MGGQVGRHAVVLGGSMAGLLAARVLAEAYDEVTVVDRDELTGAEHARRGVPQGAHAHALLAQGQQTLERLFPGLTEELSSAGIPMVDMGEMHWFLDGAPWRPARTGLIVASVTRPFLEARVRTRVAALGGVRFLERCDILGLETSANRRVVTGARVRRHAADSGEETLRADLVVDCTGRGSRTPVWLDALDFAKPEEERVKIGLSYTTCEYDLPARPLKNDLSLIPLATPNSPRGAFFGRVGGDRHILSLTGMLGDRPEAGLRGFLDYARSLPIPGIYDAIKDTEPVAEPVAIRFPASVRRRYERLTRFPERLLVLGDGVCSFNPVYGQGMTVAALEAMTLRRHLLAGGPPSPLRFFRDISGVIDAPWDIAAGGDLSWPRVEGERSAKIRMVNAYMGRLQAAALRDSRITGAFMRVAGLIDPPTALLRPGMALRVLRHSWRRPGGTGAGRGSLPAEPAATSARRR
ncbi:FAD-dependent oxidoreductase [Amycolatopsis anabasis]|uniref:FAD-dependent oxidoreductase n=1 Tax=Amycolatopsis anabasis TaxID=1840409 RepID=UPI00131CB8CA|nr:FAD-binding monooxygenase [Amycolatopsis anabasis]